ncbi:TetR/AcrR family transcriptional regulator [Glutamicibacter sp.]|uniref:TetR/AcrR family transcriptional regulator n=1 Tax=Glutamicibacter sp. TaxID=1931995 RepID=UPI0028BDA1D5|nr:TetR/AcrR family transcriptional regulator [Glutamicibacter sp.]
MQLGQVQQAAVACFARQGYTATGIRELGAAVGLNSATLYHYVGGKQELLLGIIRDCLSAMLDGARNAISRTQDPARQLAALVAFHVSFTAVNPLTAQVATGEMRALSDPAPMQALRDEYEALFAAALADGERAGIFTAPDPGLARLAIMEMGTGVGRWYRADGRLPLPEVQLHFIAMAMRILGAPETPLSPHELPTAQRVASEGER